MNTIRVSASPSNFPYQRWILQVVVGVLLQVALNPVAAGQAPAVQWRRTDWAPTHPVNGNQMQDQSGEDWWYDHKNSYANNTLNGYVCAGYSSFINWTNNETNGGCLSTSLGAPDCGSFETTGNIRGTILQTMALIDTNGANRVWFKTFNDGYFYRVIQTSDGGYLATGISGSTRKPDGSPLFYNPNQKPGQVTDQFDAGTACTSGSGTGHISLVKTDQNGNVQWQYIYAMVPYRDSSGTPQPAAAYQNYAEGWDLLETPTGHFRIVGGALDPNYTSTCNNQTTPLRRAFMIEVDANGYWVWGNFYGPTNYPSNAASIAKYSVSGNIKYVVGGTEYFQGSTFNGYTGCNFYQKTFVMQFDDSASPVAQWKKSSFDPNTSASQSNYDVQVNANGEILFPVIVNCTNCLYSGFNSGQAKVYRLDNLGNTLGACSLGQVTGFDLKVRVSPTADGGFGAVSTKQPNLPPPNFSCYGTSVWNTDAYVAKCNACDNVEWETTFDVNGNMPVPFPSDQKKQECLYSISQGADGGFVVSGNNSYNFDDGYLAKLFPASGNASNLYMSDTVNDIGLEPDPDPGPMWASGDIWVRPDNNSGFSDDTHINPEYGQYNYVFVRIKNKGCQSANGTLKVYWSKASTGLSWPTNWNNYVPNVSGCSTGIKYGDQIGSVSGIPISLLPNQEIRVPIPWFPPNPSDFTCAGPEPGHFCLLARIETLAGMTYLEGSDINWNVNSNNKIVWKNVAVVDDVLEKAQPIIVRNTSSEIALTTLSFEIPETECQDSFFTYGTVQIDLGEKLAKEWISGGSIGRGVERIGRTSIRVLKPNAWIGNVKLRPKEMHTIKVQTRFLKQPSGVERKAFNFDLVQYATRRNKLVGGVRFTVPARRKPGRGPLEVSTTSISPAIRPLKKTRGCLATIQGRVFIDLDRDGIQNPEVQSREVGLSGWTVKIIDADRNMLKAISDAQGNYSFEVQSPGVFTVSEVIQPGWQQIPPSRQTSQIVRVRAGQRIDNVNFGNLRSARKAP